MKIEGIPSNIDANHNHNVVVEISIDKETTKNVQDLLISAAALSVTVYCAKKIVDFSQRTAFELVMKEIWKR